jgi:hypothetical protein
MKIIQLIMFLVVSNVSLAAVLTPVNFFADKGDLNGYSLDNAFDTSSESQWVSAAPICSSVGGAHQMVRIELGKNKKFNRIRIENWENIDTTLRIFA